MEIEPNAISRDFHDPSTKIIHIHCSILHHCLKTTSVAEIYLKHCQSRSKFKRPKVLLIRVIDAWLPSSTYLRFSSTTLAVVLYFYSLRFSIGVTSVSSLVLDLHIWRLCTAYFKQLLSSPTSPCTWGGSPYVNKQTFLPLNIPQCFYFPLRTSLTLPTLPQWFWSVLRRTQNPHLEYWVAFLEVSH